MKRAIFNGNEARIVTRSWDGTARLWDIANRPCGQLIDVACRMLRTTTWRNSKIAGITIDKPICVPDTPASV